MINYFTTTEIWLSLEDYYNQGLPPEKAKEIIERIRNPYGSNTYLSCEKSGLNDNWIVRTFAKTPEQIRNVVYLIELDLIHYLNSQRKTNY